MKICYLQTDDVQLHEWQEVAVKVAAKYTFVSMKLDKNPSLYVHHEWREVAVKVAAKYTFVAMKLDKNPSMYVRHV